jgi:hypothetical protein
VIRYVRRFILLPSSLIFFYLLVTLIALNALVANFTTALPGVVNIQPSDQIQPAEFDIFLWDIWWVRHAVFDLRVSPLYTNYLVYPFTSPLAGHTLVLLWGLVSAPFQMLFGLIPAYNGIVVFNFLAAATAMYVFARRHVRHASVALLAGLIFAFTPAMMHRASLGHLDKLSIFWLPLSLLVWDKIVETRRWTWAVILGLCLYLSWLTDFQQTMWAMLLLVPYGLYTGFIESGRQVAGRQVNEEPGKPLRASVSPWLILLLLAVFIVPALIAPLPQLLEANRLNYPPARVEDTAHFAFSPRYFFAPDANGDFSIGVLLPLLTLVSIPFIRRDGRRWLWLGIAALCFLLALGPYFEIGETRLPLPYALLHAALGNQYRTPMRFATPGVLALAMLVALTLDYLLRTALRATHHVLRITYGVVAILVLLFTLDYRLWQPFPITIMPDYRAYRDIAAAPGDFAVLAVPIGVRTGFAVVGRGEYLQYYQTIHRRPTPTGYLSRLPNEIMDFFFFDPMAGALTLSRALPDEVDARLARLIDEWRIGFVVLHRDLLEPGRVKAFGDLLDRQPRLERVGEEGPLVVYRTRSP